MPQLLKLVPKSHPLLREIMPRVTSSQDPSIQSIIQDMSYSILPEQLQAAGCEHTSAAGMAANQWGIAQRIFIYTPDGSGIDKRLEVMINPTYVPYLRPGETTPATVAGYEGCFSVPLTAGNVNRYVAIKVQYQTPEGETVERLLEGWEARVFQHETDHLDGKLFDGKLDHFQGPDCVERFVFKDAEEKMNFWLNIVRPSREET